MTNFKKQIVLVEQPEILAGNLSNAEIVDSHGRIMNHLALQKRQTCHKCKKLNHYARVCRSSVDRSTQNRTWASEQQSNHQTKQRIHRVEPENEAISSESSTSDDEYLYACHTHKSSRMTLVKVKLNNVPVKLLIDTGASINIIDEATFAYINRLNPTTLKHAHTKLFAYGSTEQLPILGKFETVVSLRNG